jgi:hypothetical protein
MLASHSYLSNAAHVGSRFEQQIPCLVSAQFSSHCDFVQSKKAYLALAPPPYAVLNSI